MSLGNINLQKIPTSIIKAKIIASNRTRLGGNIFHLLMDCEKQAFMKVGTNYERLEIIREYKNISILQNYLPVPEIYDFIATGNQAIIVLEKMPGVPLHTMINSMPRQSILLIIENIIIVLKLYLMAIYVCQISL